MVVIRSVNEIVLSLIDFYRVAQPDADTKPGTVIRDLLIDGPSNQLALLYDEVAKVSNQQSLRLVIGSDLDKLAKNFGITRKSASSSSGVALLTFSSIPATININKGELVIASNGFSFAVVSGIAVSPSLANYYKSIATKYRNDLDFVGISDQYAVEVTVQSTTAGLFGDISKYSLTRTNIPGVSNVTNVNQFRGGSNQEDDATFRNRILSVFSGSSVGTALGYKNLALATTGVSDAFVVEPGDPLMTRDGTIVSEDTQGTLTVVSEGTGGKVDVVILGSNLTETVDSFIYRDTSNKNDPTDSKNDVVLGQISGDENKTINRRRIDNIKNGVLPSQPIDSLIQVTGSSSGANFKEKTVDSLGRVSGNYELVKDTSIYAGSPFGFDTFHWISDRISLFEEDRIKGKFNGQDNVSFSDVIEIPAVQQNISITNENSNVIVSDRSLIQLAHTPATNVTRVFNATTGERYTVVSQNVNGTGTVNTSGVIKISGNTLPSQSDILQVDYNWVVTFDQYSDYDGRLLTNNLREVTDSIDWGYSNLIRKEKISLTKNGSSTYFVGNTTLPISSVIAAKLFTEIDGTVTTVTTGTFTGRLSVVLNNLLLETEAVDRITFKNNNGELFNTANADGSFSNTPVVVGIVLNYTTTIILPTDTRAVAGDKVTVILNSEDLFNVTGSVGNFSNTQVTIPTANYSTTGSRIDVEIDYIASVQDLISTGITTVPFSRIGNGFGLNNSVGFSNGSPANVTRKEFLVVAKNGSNEYYVEMNLSSLDVNSTSINVLSVIRLSDNKEIWNADNAGTVTTNGVNNNYQLIFTGYNTPAIGDRVLVVYFAEDIRRSQPFTFNNLVFERDLTTLQYDSVTDKFLVDMHTFIAETGLTFQILEPNTDIVLATATDGYILTNFSNLSKCTFGSATINFSTILDVSATKFVDVTSKKIRIKNSTNGNNNNIYDITSYNSSANSLVVSNDFSQIDKKQISITRISDGKELWSDSGTISLTDNLLSFNKSSAATAGDMVLVTYFKYTGLKQAPTRLALAITDQTINSGVLSVIGTTITKAEDIVFSATNSSLRQGIFEAIRKALNLNSNATIPSNVKLVKIAKLERVSTTNSTSDDVLLSKYTYSLQGTKIQDNSFFSDTFISDTTLGAFDFVLPATQTNTTNLTDQFTGGDKFRITFYYSTTNDLENVIFTRNGTLYTNKFFALVDRVFVSSGFGTSQSAKLTVSNFNQPLTGSRYKAFYDYLAPKQNERIIIRYNYNKLVSDVTFNVESNRPINADVLIRQAKAVDIDVTMNVVISDQFKTSSALVLQNLKDKLIAAINSNSLGANLDSSSLINTAFAVDGVSGARVVFFNKSGSTGQILSVQAKDDEYFVANSVTVNVETR